MSLKLPPQHGIEEEYTYVALLVNLGCILKKLLRRSWRFCKRPGTNPVPKIDITVS